MLWNGFECEEFEFDGYPAKIIMPKKRAENACLILKTEYFGAFPEAEIALLEKGYFLGFVKNENRWGLRSDVDRKAAFVKYAAEKYGFACKCVPVGMSCGGIFAVKLAALHPEVVSCIYLDAPVVNYMSCPCGFGGGVRFDPNHEEIMQALSFNSVGELLAYRDMPLDHLPALIKNKIPALLIAGDSDKTVPFDENGAFVERTYRSAGAEIEVYIKPGCDHHPHGLDDPAPIVDFIVNHC